MQKVGILDFGGQYAHLIANRVRRLGVYSEILSPKVSLEQVQDFQGLIFSGGPASVYTESIKFNHKLLNFTKPILGICYGHQLINYSFGGKVKVGKVKEYGKAYVQRLEDNEPLFKNLAKQEVMWMSHGDEVTKLASNFKILAKTANCPIAAAKHTKRPIYGLQFHPEVTHSKNGMTLLKNFLEICQCNFSWNLKSYLEQTISSIREKVQDKKVFLLVSGGVDSNVAFSLLNKALGNDKVYGLHIDNGLMRLDESRWVQRTLKEVGFENFHIVDAQDMFLNNIGKTVDPQQKRQIIGDTFLDVKNCETQKLNLCNNEWILGQGTIYPDTIESGKTENSSLIKTHHNRVDRVQELIAQGKIIEPLADLYKDEVRELGELLGLPKKLVWRHPFPGPGLGVRILCSHGNMTQDFTQEETQIAEKLQNKGYKIKILPIKSVGVQGDERSYAHACILEGELNWQELEKVSIFITNNFSQMNRVIYSVAGNLDDKFYLNQAYITKKRCNLLRKLDALNSRLLEKFDLYDKIWQMPVVLIPSSSEKEKESVLLRPIYSTEAMTASFCHFPQEYLDSFSKKVFESYSSSIANIFYDITNKPPATIEWE